MPRAISGIAFLLLSACAGYGHAPEIAAVPLTVEAGTPLRLYVTRRFKKKQGAAVTARLIEPVYAFDREVIPAGTEVTGTVARTPGAGRFQRLRALLGGDFTPYKSSLVEFDTLTLPDGRKLSIRTVETAGLRTLYIAHKRKSPPPANPQGIEGKVKAQVDARVESVADTVRMPGKKEALLDMAMAKLPYHPQYVRSRTRFDAELSIPLSFGTEPVTRAAIAAIGSQPAPDSTIAARLLTAVDSGTAKQGDAVEAELTAPLFDSAHRLVLPEGTRLKGAVVVVQSARWLHRSGKLRFNFADLELPPEVAALRALPAAAPAPNAAPPQEALQVRTQAIVSAGESDGKASTKVDSEGGVKASEPKTRFLAPIVALWAAGRSADNDRVRGPGGQPTGTLQRNEGGRILGGGLGFGLLGSAISQSSRYVGMAFGYYGLAWSVYSNVFARGAEVHFDRNAVLEIKFGGRPSPK